MDYMLHARCRSCSGDPNVLCAASLHVPNFASICLCIYTVHVAITPVVNPFTTSLILSGLFPTGDTKRAFPERYRDTWPESELVGIAAEEAEALGAPVEVAA